MRRLAFECGTTLRVVNFDAERRTTLPTPFRSSITSPIMLICEVCKVEVTPEQTICHLCGSPRSNSQRQCSNCRRVFDDSFKDDFCPCGTELFVVLDVVEDEPSPVPLDPYDFLIEPLPESTPPAPPPPPIIFEPEPAASNIGKPAVGTICLVLYSATKPRQPLKYFALNKDVTLIGRLDSVNNVFPDIDLSEHLDEAVSRKVSRKHVEIYRSRERQTFRLLALPGNTGTHVDQQLIDAGQEVELTDGTPVVLGRSVWLKFETVT